jgi:3-isopropylmalate dehydrogenase
MGAALEILAAVKPMLPWQVAVSELPLGRAALPEFGQVAPATVLDRASSADAVLAGAVDTVGMPAEAAGQGSAILALRRRLGCYVALRPVRIWPGTASGSPVRAHIRERVDMLFVRELTGGAYAGPHRHCGGQTGTRSASDQMVYSEAQVRRAARVGFEQARQRRGRVTSVDKADALATGSLWREVVAEVAAQYPDVVCEHLLADNLAFQLIRRPADFDVILTSNLLGDILSDEAAALSGSIGLLPSGSLSRRGSAALYEPIHGSAPQIAGQGVANPIGAILSLAMLLRAEGAARAADAIEAAVDAGLRAGVCTPDLGGSDSTAAVTQAIAARL